MDKFTVCQEIKNYIRFANSKFNGKTKNPQKNSQQTYRFDTNILTKLEQDNIYGLYLFMRCNPQVTDYVIQTLIADDQAKLKVLKAMCKEYHGFVNDLRTYGFNNMCNSIVKTRKTMINKLV